MDSHFVNYYGQFTVQRPPNQTHSFFCCFRRLSCISDGLITYDAQGRVIVYYFQSIFFHWQYCDFDILMAVLFENTDFLRLIGTKSIDERVTFGRRLLANGFTMMAIYLGVLISPYRNAR